ncbi:MAG: DNA ligase [Gammaproteobacteria bacterium]|nr:DNA ligase [Gammaproteobacteria bacterium]MCW8839492.1 DNA ligase [Gammaproteobacteria bacterium]MCW8957902.1 DNA ligase [Gammaproteobacteria bacterium]MCW8972306.1 DNA ligase [Gammaproteobacteria bacterium]MCW8992724.1 DNA ligase [Gammaproteobacteria bacterium]
MTFSPLHPLSLTLLLLGLFTIAPLHAEPPQLMLATVWDRSDNPAGWWMSEKYDGVRGYWDGKQMVSRGGGPIVLPQSLQHALPPFPLDGELWAGRDRFAHTLATVRDRQPGEGWADIRYLVFDAPAMDGTFEARLAMVEQWLSENPAETIRTVKQIRCRGEGHLQQFLDGIEARSGEGVMLRAAASPYQAGRSPHLRKVKRFDDSEAVVVGYNPGKGKYTGMVGSLQLELADGTRFAAGSGLSDAERQNPPPIGATITFKHHGWTRHGKPRFPVFWRVRAP